MSRASMLRKLVHDVFYKIAPKSVVEMSMTCKNIVPIVDGTSSVPNNLKSRIGYKMHLSICEACRRYEKYSDWLKSSIHEHEYENSHHVPEEKISEISESLLKKYSKVK